MKRLPAGSLFFSILQIDPKYFKENFHIDLNLLTFGQDENRKNAKADLLNFICHENNDFP